jgi:hypothetical protein
MVYAPDAPPPSVGDVTPVRSTLDDGIFHADLTVIKVKRIESSVRQGHVSDGSDVGADLDIDVPCSISVDVDVSLGPERHYQHSRNTPKRSPELANAVEVNIFPTSLIGFTL